MKLVKKLTICIQFVNKDKQIFSGKNKIKLKITALKYRIFSALSM